MSASRLVGQKFGNEILVHLQTECPWVRSHTRALSSWALDGAVEFFLACFFVVDIY